MKKKSKPIIITSVLITIAIILILTTNSSQPKKHKVCFRSSCFSIEIADTEEERAKGLMFKKSLDQDKGMLFIFNKSEKHTFWMKNTLISLDIIWLDKNKKITHILNNALPCKQEPCRLYSPDTNSLYVLELNSGKSKELNLSIGDEISFSLNDYE